MKLEGNAKTAAEVKQNVQIVEQPWFVGTPGYCWTVLKKINGLNVGLFMKWSGFHSAQKFPCSYAVLLLHSIDLLYNFDSLGFYVCSFCLPSS